MLAGPNGAGKTSFYEDFLSEVRLSFINADLVAARTGIPSEEVARLLDAARDELIRKRAGFITETVFSDPVGVKLELLRRAVDGGYEVTLIYIAIPPDLSDKRIDQRVAAGGHDVPRDRIASRFARSLANLRAAIKFVPLVKIYDNSSIQEPFRLIAIFNAGRRVFVAESIPDWAKSVLKAQRRSGGG
jgi:predicted ABC-type ATPase